MPPYSPDPSPIEMVFAMLTADLRAAARIMGDLWQAISSNSALYSPEECSYYFAAAG